MRSLRLKSNGITSEKIKTIKVGGMTCDHCKANVENSIRPVDGVEDVTVDLSTGQVDIRGDSFDMERISKGIKRMGYKIIKG